MQTMRSLAMMIYGLAPQVRVGFSADEGDVSVKLAAKIIRLPSGLYQAWCPALPGCKAMGQSAEEACAKILAAVKGYLSSLDVALPREIDKHLVVTPAQSAA